MQCSPQAVFEYWPALFKSIGQFLLVSVDPGLILQRATSPPPFLVVAWVQSLEEPTFIPISLFSFPSFPPSFTLLFRPPFLSYFNFFLPPLSPCLYPISFSSSIFSFLFPFFPLFFLPLSFLHLLFSWLLPPLMFVLFFFPFSPFNHFFFSYFSHLLALPPPIIHSKNPGENTCRSKTTYNYRGWGGYCA